MRRDCLLALTFAGLLASSAPAAQSKPILIKVVILTTFESGASAGTGTRAGEFGLWADRLPLRRRLSVPGIEGRVLLSDDGVLGVVTGMRARPRESVTALILDRELDVSHAYWIVAGIAGVDPRAGSIGSAAWALYVVDADPVFEMDDREIPEDWSEGLWSLGTDRPGVKGSAPGSSDMVWKLNPGLVNWAYALTRDIPLADTADLKAARAGYSREPAALKPPTVFLGDEVSTTRFWHGERRTQWARDWMKLWTDGAGTFAMTACEDQGILDVLGLFARAGRIDNRRVLVLRTASNYSREADGADPSVHFAHGGAGAAFEAAYRVGSPVVKALVAGWAEYATTPPEGKNP
ncbi:MAG TPA: purine nucleoside permease [Steroidobacteraceae bacterium]|jgi:purine nucleoside permease